MIEKYRTQFVTVNPQPSFPASRPTACVLLSRPQPETAVTILQSASQTANNHLAGHLYNTFQHALAIRTAHLQSGLCCALAQTMCSEPKSLTQGNTIHRSSFKGIHLANYESFLLWACRRARLVSRNINNINDNY